MNSNNLRNPLKTARGWGASKSGTSHFIRQRATAIALIGLALYVIGLLLFCVTSLHATAIDVVKHPFNAVVLIAFIIAMFWHSKLGLQAIIEDYVKSPGSIVVLQLINIFVNAFAALAGVLAIVRIALGA